MSYVASFFPSYWYNPPYRNLSSKFLNLSIRFTALTAFFFPLFLFILKSDLQILSNSAAGGNLRRDEIYINNRGKRRICRVRKCLKLEVTARN